MKRTFTAVAAAAGVLGFAAMASAVTMSMVASGGTNTPPVFHTGDTIVITITADSQGVSGDLVSVALYHDVSLVTGLGVVGPTATGTSEDGGIPDLFQQGGGFVNAGRGGNEGNCIAANKCLAWDQYFGAIKSIDGGPEQSILHYTADAAGVANFTVVNDGSAGDWHFGDALNTAHGDPSAAGFSGISVTIIPIPEPTTGALLGLGLFALAMGGRRR